MQMEPGKINLASQQLGVEMMDKLCVGAQYAAVSIQAVTESWTRH